jgi:hypothetical protein
MGGIAKQYMFCCRNRNKDRRASDPCESFFGLQAWGMLSRPLGKIFHKKTAMRTPVSKSMKSYLNAAEGENSAIAAGWRTSDGSAFLLDAAQGMGGTQPLP